MWHTATNRRNRKCFLVLAQAVAEPIVVLSSLRQGPSLSEHLLFNVAMSWLTGFGGFP